MKKCSFSQFFQQLFSCWTDDSVKDSSFLRFCCQTKKSSEVRQREIEKEPKRERERKKETKRERGRKRLSERERMKERKRERE